MHTNKKTSAELCKALKVNPAYLSNLRKTKTPQIKGSIIANLCEKYGASPAWILLGIKETRGRKAEPDIMQKLEAIDHNVKEVLEKVLEAVLTDKPNILTKPGRN